MASLRMFGLIELARRIQFNDSGGVKLLAAVAMPPPGSPIKLTRPILPNGSNLDHLMLLPRDPSSLDGMGDDFNTGAPYVMFPGTSGAHVMIPVDGYYEYQAPQ